jgi:hypothetical protein
MFHTTLYRLERSQKRVLAILGILFLILSIGWFFSELYDRSFPMEPIVVFVGGTATLLASYWPWKPHYTDRRLKGRASLDYMSNDHKFVIGREELCFTLKFSKASDQNIYLYSDPPDIDAIALAHGAGRPNEIRDATALDYRNRAISAAESNVVIMRNQHGNYAAVTICDVKDLTRGDDRDEVTISWMINPEQGTDFS